MAVRTFCKVAADPTKHWAPPGTKLQVCVVPRQLLGVLSFRALAMCACTRRTSSHMGLGVSWARPPQPYSALGPCRRGGSPTGSFGRSHQRVFQQFPTATVGLELLVYCHRSFPPNRGCRRWLDLFSHACQLLSFHPFCHAPPLCSLRARSRFRPSPHSSPQGFFLPLFFSWLCSPWL